MNRFSGNMAWHEGDTTYFSSCTSGKVENFPSLFFSAGWSSPIGSCQARPRIDLAAMKVKDTARGLGANFSPLQPTPACRAGSGREGGREALLLANLSPLSALLLAFQLGQAVPGLCQGCARLGRATERRSRPGGVVDGWKPCPCRGKCDSWHESPSPAQPSPAQPSAAQPSRHMRDRSRCHEKGVGWGGEQL